MWYSKFSNIISIVFNFKYKLILTIILFIVILILKLLFSFYCNISFKKKYQKINSISYIIFNKNNNVVKILDDHYNCVFFDKIQVLKFYLIFNNDFNDWCEDLLVNSYKNINFFFKTSLNINKKKISIVLKNIFINKQEKIFHFKNYVFSPLLCDNEINTTLTEIIHDKIFLSSFFLKNCLFVYFNFPFLKNYLYFLKLKEIILLYKFKKKIIELSNNEIIILIFNKDNEAKITDLINKIIKDMYRFLELNNVNIKIISGILKDDYFFNISCAIAKIKKNLNNTNLLRENLKKTNIINNELKEFLNNKNNIPIYFFTPIFDIEMNKVKGYLMRTNIDYLFNEVSKNNKDYEFLKNIFEKLFVNYNFHNENYNYLLFYDLHFFNFNDNLIKTFKFLFKTINIVFCFNEVDFTNLTKKKIFLFIEKIKKYNFNICLKLNNIFNKNFFSEEEYNMFDYIIFCLKKDENYEYFFNMMKKINKFNKKTIIINYNAKKWNVFKEIVNNGFKYIINEHIAHTSRILLVPNENTMLKIKNIVNNVNNDGYL